MQDQHGARQAGALHPHGEGHGGGDRGAQGEDTEEGEPALVALCGGAGDGAQQTLQGVGRVTLVCEPETY